MFIYSQSVKQYIVLWTYTQTTSYQIHLCQYTVPINIGITSGWCEQTSQYRHSGSLSGTVVS